MRIDITEGLALPFQARPVMPSEDDSLAQTTMTSPQPPQTQKTSIHDVRKQTEASLSSPPPNRLKVLQRRVSSSYASFHRRNLKSSKSCVSYAGPQPTGPDGCPLRSCLKTTSIDQSIPSNLSGRSSFASGHGISFSHVQVREYCR